MSKRTLNHPEYKQFIINSIATQHVPLFVMDANNQIVDLHNDFFKKPVLKEEVMQSAKGTEEKSFTSKELEDSVAEDIFWRSKERHP